MMSSTMPDISPSILGFPEFSAVLGTLPSLKYSAVATVNDLEHIAFGNSEDKPLPWHLEVENKSFPWQVCLGGM